MILILDFGSQYTQLIGRTIREIGVYCEIVPYNFVLNRDVISSKKIQGIILSGGPSSVYDKNSPKVDISIFDLGVPILGICYGMQLINFLLGGKVKKALKHEYGFSKLEIMNKNEIFSGLPNEINVWMSHGDKLQTIPDGFVNLARSSNSEISAFANFEKKIYGLQFHPEVKHTEFGKDILRNFLTKVCRLETDWSMKNFLEETSKEIRNTVGKEKVILALSGGVDSSVTSVLLHRAIGRQLYCVFIDNGLLRFGEKERVKRIFRPIFGNRLIIVDAQKRFLKKLKGVVDPEEKRKRIGREFISVFEEVAKKIKNVKFLAQGTLYPDLIESVSVKGPSAKIKTHHNVGGLPEKMKLKLVEPLKYLFKDEVRVLGKELGLPDEIIQCQPFPGPGLAVRILGEVTVPRLDIVRKANRIVEEEIAQAIKNKIISVTDIWQSFAVLLPVKTVGIMGDKRTYENVVALRIVQSQDAMTADWVKLPYDILGRISNRIINEVHGVNRVVYDISSKPPATIEWE